MSTHSTSSVHFVGSVRLPGDHENPLVSAPTAEDVFRGIVTALPTGVRRLPDGETGFRHNFASWQSLSFMQSPWTLRPQVLQKYGVKDLPPAFTDNVEETKRKIEIGPTAYDLNAARSYAAFKRLKDEGTIGKDVRFQVTIPGLVNAVLFMVQPEYQAEVEPLYEQALVFALRSMQALIPASELAIQFDLPGEIGVLAGAWEAPGAQKYGPHLRPWFEQPYLPAIVERVQRLAAEVQDGVELGFHLCYGDSGHKHFLEPVDTSLMVKLFNTLAEAIHRPINWVHMPVPKDRSDEAYYEPLRDLNLANSTELYLGLVHADDGEGTKKRIETARRVLGTSPFGISTECGLGRTPVEDIPSIFQILKDCSETI